MSAHGMASPSARRRVRSPGKTAVFEEASPGAAVKSIFSLSAPEFLHPYLSANPKKRDGEWFFLWFSAVWVGFFALVLIFRLWDGISDLGYNTIGLVVFIPCFAIPLVVPLPGEKKQVWYRRYTFKANLWMAAFNFVGNYFWTHYFFALLGAKYTFPINYSYLNRVPIVCYLLTQAYFQTYHVVTNLFLRFIKRRFETSNTWFRIAAMSLAIGAISIFWAYLETKTIESFPYYSFADRDRMYQIGLTFYALYFIVSFPMFLRLDEDPKDSWDWTRSLFDSLAAAMIVSILCDFWRLLIGNIVPGKVVDTLPHLL